MRTRSSASHLASPFFAIFLGVSFGICVQMWRINGKSQEFISNAKLVLVSDSVTEELLYSRINVTIIETIESEEIARRATKKVQALDPEWASTHFEISATQTRGSSTYSLKATARDPRHLTNLLTFAIDETLNLRLGTRQKMGSRENDVVILEQPSPPRQDIVRVWVLPLAISALFGGLLGLSLLKALSVFASRNAKLKIG